MSEPTHATVATFRMDMSRASEHERALRDLIVPGVRRHPGFVGGHWMLDRDRAQSTVVLTYHSRDSAEAMRDNVIGNAANQAAAGIELVSIRVLEVTASA